MVQLRFWNKKELFKRVSSYNHIRCVVGNECFQKAKYSVAKQTPNQNFQSTKSVCKWKMRNDGLWCDAEHVPLSPALTHLSDRYPVSGISRNPPILLIVPTSANLYSFSSHRILNWEQREVVIVSHAMEIFANQMHLPLSTDDAHWFWKWIHRNGALANDRMWPMDMTVHLLRR